MKRSKTCWTSAGSDAVTPRSLLRLWRGPRGSPGALPVRRSGAARRAGREGHAVEGRVAHVLRRADALAACLALQLLPQVVREPDRRGLHTAYNAGSGSGFARDIGSGGEEARELGGQQLRRGEVRPVALALEHPFLRARERPRVHLDRLDRPGGALTADQQQRRHVETPELPLLDAVGELRAQLTRHRVDDPPALLPQRRLLQPVDVGLVVAADVVQELARDGVALTLLDQSLPPIDPSFGREPSSHRRLVQREPRKIEPQRRAGRDEPAVGVAEQERAVAGVPHHRGHVVALALQRVVGAVGGVAAPAPIDRDHREAVLEVRPQHVEAPPRRPRAVDRHERRPRAGRLTGEPDAVRRGHMANHRASLTASSGTERSENRAPQGRRERRVRTHANDRGSRGGDDYRAGQLSLPRRSQQYSSTASAASSISRSWESQGSTVLSACSSLTPASNASSPLKPAAMRSASRRWSPSSANAPSRNSLFAIGWPTSSEACQAASIDRSSSSSSSTALA